MKGALLAAVTLISISGCATRGSPPPRSAPAAQIPQAVPAGPEAGTAAEPRAATIHPLPFKGKLVEGERSELPPSVAMSLDDSSPITFSYREELTHYEHHTPRMIAGFDPRSYFGNPTGEYIVTVFASLVIADGDRTIGHYEAETRITRSYTMYSQPTHRELENGARTAVRADIEQKLERDYDKLAASLRASE